MRNLPIIALCLGVLAPSLAAAAPTADELTARKAELEKKLKGQNFTVVVEAPFVVVGDRGRRRGQEARERLSRWTVGLLEKDYFTKQPDKVIEVWLFGNERTYRAGAKKYFNDEPETPYGYYSPTADALIMNIGPGAGTLSHELVHPYMEANFPNVPSWFNEGLALALRAAHREGRPHLGPAELAPAEPQEAAPRQHAPSIPTLLKTSRDGFYNADYDSYAFARYLMLYLQEQGKLRDFYLKFLADKKDLTGQAAMEDVPGERARHLRAQWRKWALALVSDNRELPSIVLGSPRRAQPTAGDAPSAGLRARCELVHPHSPRGAPRSASRLCSRSTERSAAIAPAGWV